MAVGENEMVVALGRIVGPDHVLSGNAVHTTYECDAYTIDKSAPQCVVLPFDTSEVQKVVRWCVANDVPFTPRGAGTGLSGGAMPAKGGVSISTKRMTRIMQVDIENRCLHAQAGVVNIKVSRAVSEFGLHFAPDPSSQTVSTIGGNIAENSGGPHTLKYGVTAQHILQITLVDTYGDVHVIGSRVDGAPGLDLLSLVVGGEGTVGVVTEAWLRLTPLPETTRTILACFPDALSATHAVTNIIAGGTIPAALEMIDENCLKAVLSAFPLEVAPDTKALLLIECDGTTVRTDQETTEVVESCRSCGSLRIDVAQDEKERALMWSARKKGIGAMGRLAPTIVTHDGVIPRSKLPEMLEFIYQVAKEDGIGVGNMFHAGDGNLHPIFFFDDRVPGKIEAVIRAGEKVITKCIELGGSASGEHGIGVEKSDLLRLMFDEQDMRLQRDAKSIFGSSTLCNPCKVIPNQKGCVEHVKRWRGAAT